MLIPAEPYLHVIRDELAGIGAQPLDAAAARSLKYAHRMITHILTRAELLPRLQRETLARFDGLLDALCAALREQPDTMILVSELIRSIRTAPDFILAEHAMQNAVRLLVAAGGERNASLLADIADITASQHDALHAAVLAADFRPRAADAQGEALDATQRERLRDWLRRTIAGESEVDVVSTRAIIGGGSKATIFVELARARVLPETVVLRMDSAAGLVASTVVDEYFLIELMHEAGLPVPRPFALERDAAVLGAPFVIIGRIEGHNVGDWSDVFEPSREFALDLARAIARMHRIPVEKVGDRLHGAGMGTRERMLRDMDSFEHSWRSSGKPSVVLEQAYAWLRANLHLADGARAILHCDLGCHNMLGHEGRLAALLDWETAVVGNPAQDLAYVKPLATQILPWEEFLAVYVDAGGVLPSAGEMDFYELWCALFRVHYGLVVRSYFLSGVAPGLVPAYASQGVYVVTTQALHQVVKRLYAR